MGHGPSAVLSLICWTAALFAISAAGSFANEFAPERFGIGAAFGQADSTSPVEVLQCIAQGPAERSGLLRGDCLVGLDSLSVEGWRLQRVLSYLLRPEPTPVALTVRRGSQQLTVLVQRMRMSNVAAGADLKWALDADSTGYQLVPLVESRQRQVGDTLKTAPVISRECTETLIRLGRGRRTLIYFWARWCTPCKQFIASLKQAVKSGAQGHRVRIVGINLDADCATFQDWNARLAPPGEQYAGGGWQCELAQWLRIYRRGIPSGALLAEDGKLLRFATGSDSLLALLKHAATLR